MTIVAVLHTVQCFLPNMLNQVTYLITSLTPRIEVLIPQVLPCIRFRGGALNRQHIPDEGNASPGLTPGGRRDNRNPGTSPHLVSSESPVPAGFTFQYLLLLPRAEHPRSVLSVKTFPAAFRHGLSADLPVVNLLAPHDGSDRTAPARPALVFACSPRLPVLCACPAAFSLALPAGIAPLACQQPVSDNEHQDRQCNPYPHSSSSLPGFLSDALSR